jgi:hypothetical protein
VTPDIMLYVFGINADRGGMRSPKKLLALLLHAWKPIVQVNTRVIVWIQGKRRQLFSKLPRSRNRGRWFSEMSSCFECSAIVFWELTQSGPWPQHDLILYVSVNLYPESYVRTLWK